MPRQIDFSDEPRIGRDEGTTSEPGSEFRVRRASEIGPTRTGELSLTERILGGLVVGAHRDPLLEPIVEGVGKMFGVSKQDLGDFQRRLSNSRISDVFEVVGEFGPTLALGVGAFGLGRSLAVKGFGAAGRAGLLGGGRVGAQGLRTAERLLQGSARAPIGTPGVRPIPKPGLERAAEIAGGGLGIGGVSGAETAARGGNAGEIAKATALGTILAAGFETGVTLAARGLTRRTRGVDERDVRRIFEGSGSKGVILDEEARLATRVGKLNTQIRQVLGVESQEQSFLRAFRRAPGEKQAEARELFQELRAARTGFQATQRILSGEPGVIYSRELPYNPSGNRAFFAKLNLQLARTPESLEGQLGESGARFFRSMRQIADDGSIAGSVNHGNLVKLHDRARRALRISSREARGSTAWAPVFNAWEKNGEQGLRNLAQKRGMGAKQTDNLVGVFQELRTEMRQIYTRVRKAGEGQPFQTAEELTTKGLSEHIPHTLADIPEDQVAARLAKSIGERRAAELMDQATRGGPAKFGSIDYQRLTDGSLADKVARGMPFDPNPWNGILRYLNAAHQRVSIAKNLGPKGELRDTMIEAVVKEGGSRELITSIADVAIGHTYYKQAMRQFSRTVTGYQVGSKLMLAFIPQSSQTINTALFTGLRNTARGLAKAARGENKDKILANVALMDSITGIRAFGEERFAPMAAKSIYDRVSNGADRFAYWTLNRLTPFNFGERWNRSIAGAAGEFMFRDTLAKAVLGKLRGNSLDTARRRFKSLNLDLDDTVSKVRQGGDRYLQAAKSKRGIPGQVFEEIESSAVFRTAQQTQFIPSTLRRPTAWNHPYGRIIFQFKTFALGQGRLIRDQVLAEAALGNPKPMAYFLSIYPVAGEVIGDVKALVRGKAREESGITRVASDFSMVGGIGVATDMLSAAKYGRLLEFLAGPTVSTLGGFAEAMLSGSMDGIRRQVTKEPAFKAFRSLIGYTFLSMQRLSDYIDQVGDFGETTGATTIDFSTAAMAERERVAKQTTGPKRRGE